MIVYELHVQDYTARIQSLDPAKRGQPFTVDNLDDWSQGDWKILARSWFGGDADFGDVDNWEATCPAAGASIEIKARSLAVLVSDND
ncbi:MAG: hypothetical protein H6557_21820 [Lewinellaceae bacterium]|nr:hypothetical protein [Phaeodactylibacter sp.]MCB9039260.1 hypothetical protein [Lewinellaceae bacterium]